jgi:uncharacterized protein
VSEPPALVRAVLDTSVLRRGVTSVRGPSGQILDALARAEFHLVTSESILTELGNVLRRGRPRRRRLFTDGEVEAILQALRRVAETVPGAYVVKMVRTDPDDDHVLAAAIEAGAGYIVAEDKRDLLPLKVKLVSGYSPIQLVDARDFLQVLRRT